MRLFISHANTNLEVAEALKLRLSELPDVVCFLLATDIAPGEDWEQRIRQAAHDCDAIACLVTPDYIQRPWFYAEWATFWYQEKPWYLLMLDAGLDDVFEVMRRRQTTFLDQRRSVERLITSLLAGRTSERSPDLLADELVKAVREGRRREVSARAEANLARLSLLLQGNQDNVSAPLIDELLAADQIERVVGLASSARSDGPTKRRQLGVILVQRGLANAAAEFDHLIANNAERRTIGLACLDRMEIVPDDHSAQVLLFKIYRGVREPQRRDLRHRAVQMGLDIDWPEVESNP